MKRIIPLILAVSLVVTLLAGISVSAADYNDEYVYDFTEIQVEGTQVSHDPDAGDGYATVTSTDDASDPYFFINNLKIPSTQKIIAVKYAVESLHNNNLYVSADADGSAPYDLDWGAQGSWIGPNMITDGEWHLAIYDVTKAFPGVGDLYITTFRLPGATAGNVFKIEYIGFFTSEEEAKAYESSRSGAPVEDPTTSDKPYVDWANYGKGVHVSWDSLRVNESGNFIDGIQDGGANLSAWLKEHGNTVDGSDSSISKLFLKGWTGLDQKVVKIGYSVDNGTPVFATEEDALDYNVSDPVKAAGGEFAVRYNLTIDVSQISGSHKITVVVELEDGTVVSLAAGDPPMTFTYQGPGEKTPETPDVPATSDATAVVFMIAAAAVVVTVLLKKKAF